MQQTGGKNVFRPFHTVSVGILMADAVKFAECRRSGSVAAEKDPAEICRVIEAALRNDLFYRLIGILQQFCGIFAADTVETAGKGLLKVAVEYSAQIFRIAMKHFCRLRQGKILREMELDQLFCLKNQLRQPFPRSVDDRGAGQLPENQFQKQFKDSFVRILRLLFCEETLKIYCQLLRVGGVSGCRVIIQHLWTPDKVEPVKTQTRRIIPQTSVTPAVPQDQIITGMQFKKSAVFKHCQFAFDAEDQFIAVDRPHCMATLAAGYESSAIERSC